MVEKQKPQAPRDRILPLKFVEFVKPVVVEGFPYPLRKFVAGIDPCPEVDTPCPKLFVDPELQAIRIGDRHFPFAAFPCWYERAKSA